MCKFVKYDTTIQNNQSYKIQYDSKNFECLPCVVKLGHWKWKHKSWCRWFAEAILWNFGVIENVRDIVPRICRIPSSPPLQRVYRVNWNIHFFWNAILENRYIFYLFKNTKAKSTLLKNQMFARGCKCVNIQVFIHLLALHFVAKLNANRIQELICNIFTGLW